MKIPKLALALAAGCVLGVAAPALVSSARAQQAQPRPLPPPPPPPGGVRYQYHVINLGWSNAQSAEDTFNRLGQDGWRVVAEAGSYVTFERAWPVR